MLDRVYTRLKETSETTIMLVIIVMNRLRMVMDRARSIFAALLGLMKRLLLGLLCGTSEIQRIA